MKTKNMNYMFNVEYFDDIQLMEKRDVDIEKIKKRNGEIKKFTFSNVNAPYEQWREFPGYSELSLYTLYPGLLIGSGNPHGIVVEGAAKLGLSFDYVTGLPYIPGSSLKGMLRAYFPGDTSDDEKNDELRELISGLLSQIAPGVEVDVDSLKNSMFEGSDIYFGAFPVPGKSMIEMDYITKHEKFKNPQPISFMKVKPGVKFIFSAVFYDDILAAEQKKALCKELIILMGIGAKTNTGYGRFSETEPPAEPNIVKFGNPTTGNKTNSNKGPVCEKCGRTVGINAHTGKPYRFCYKCNQNK